MSIETTIKAQTPLPTHLAYTLMASKLSVALNGLLNFGRPDGIPIVVTGDINEGAILVALREISKAIGISAYEINSGRTASADTIEGKPVLELHIVTAWPVDHHDVAQRIKTATLDTKNRQMFVVVDHIDNGEKLAGDIASRIGVDQFRVGIVSIDPI